MAREQAKMKGAETDRQINFALSASAAAKFFSPLRFVVVDDIILE